MRRRTAVSVNDDFSARDAGVTMWPPDNESPSRVHMIRRSTIKHRFRNDRLDDMGDYVVSHFFRTDRRGMLTGHNHGVDSHRPVAVVFDRDLRLPIRPKIL